MAGLQDVLDALVSEVRLAIAGLPPALVYAGWPTQANLQDVVAKGIQSHVSVYALPGERNTTRFARDLVVEQPPSLSLQARTERELLTFEGTTATDQHVSVRIDAGPPIAYPVPKGMTLANVALGVADAINAVGLPGLRAAALGPTVILSGAMAPRLAIAIGGTGRLARLLRQQEKQFMLTVWAPAPDIRERLAEAIDGRLGTMDRLPLRDFPARIRYQGTYEEEPLDRLPVFRRSLTYSVEWAKTLTLPATQVIDARMTFER